MVKQSYFKKMAEEKKAAARATETPLLQMDNWLRTRGLGRFTERLQDFGIESVSDLMDSDIVTDYELRLEIGMNGVEIEKFRDAVSQNRVVELLPAEKEHEEKIQQASAAFESHPEASSFAQYALFVRKMHRTLHCQRVDKQGKLKPCAMHMTRHNQGFMFNDGAQNNVELLFEGMRGIHSLVDELTNDPKHRFLVDFLTPEQVSNSVMLTFSYREIHEEEEKGDTGKKKKKSRQSIVQDKADKAAILAGRRNSTAKTKNKELDSGGDEKGVNKSSSFNEKGSFVGMFARKGSFRKSDSFDEAGKVGNDGKKAYVRGSRFTMAKKVHDSLVEIARQESTADWFENSSSSSSATLTTAMLAEFMSADDTMAAPPGQGTMVALLLVCSSPEDCEFVMRGFRHSANHFADKGRKLMPELHRPATICHPGTRWPEWLLFLNKFHHLYRSHHHHNHPPARFHNNIIAEVSYDLSYDVVMVDDRTGKTVNTVKMPCAVFVAGMYARCKILGYDKTSETYKLQYQDGPYLAHENGDGTKLFRLPPDLAAKCHFQFKNVKASFMTVDMIDNYGSSLPVFILLTSLVQTLLFLLYLSLHPEVPLTSSSPIAGPQSTWMRVVGTFPMCSDLRPEVWRLVTHQFVHSGYQHVGFNIVLQTLFGLPINMVHGNLRFGFIYTLGVIGGAMTFSAVGGAHGALVGCSGGVYAIFGMHLAEIIVNWDVESKGLMNHWTRLLVIGLLLCIDFFLYYTMPSETTSYSAHIGGWMVGLIVGILVLEDLEMEWCEKYLLFPLAALVGLVGAIAVPWYYFKGPFPPEAALFAIDAEPCCWQLMRCPNIDPEHYSLFKCYDHYAVKGGRHFRDTCEEFEMHIERYFNPDCTGPYCDGYKGVDPDLRVIDA